MLASHRNDTVCAEELASLSAIGVLECIC